MSARSLQDTVIVIGVFDLVVIVLRSICILCASHIPLDKNFLDGPTAEAVVGSASSGACFWMCLINEVCKRDNVQKKGHNA
jgi:hypothetical protein